MIPSKNFKEQISKIPLPTTYNNETNYLDPFRKKLVTITSEERVRQRVARYLQMVLEVPKSMVFLEDHLSHYGSDRNGRVDIVVCEVDENTNTIMALAVVECKSEEVDLVAKYLSRQVDMQKS